MKKFILISIIFSIPFILFIVSLEYSLRKIPNGFTLKNELLVKKGLSIKHLIIGSSVAADGINPLYLPDSTYNLAVSGQWFRFNKAILEKHIDKMPNLKSVILGIAYQALWSDEISSDGAFINNLGEENRHRLACYNLYMDICFDRNPLRLSELLSSSRLSLKKWYKYYVMGEDVVPYDSLGAYKTAPNLTDDRFDDLKARAEWLRRLKNDISSKMYQENIQRMNEMARLCNEKGIALYIVITPHYKGFCELADKEQITEMKEAIKSVTDKWDNVYMYDYFYDSRFSDEDFANGNHLSKDKGAEKFSKILNDVLKYNIQTRQK